MKQREMMVLKLSILQFERPEFRDKENVQCSV